MATKIDISSLDATTKKKIKELKNRVGELTEGVSKKITITVEVNLNAHWAMGETCFTDFYYPDDESAIDLETKKYKKQIDEEIKVILDFSDSVADKLGVDRTEFWDQCFLG